MVANRQPEDSFVSSNQPLFTSCNSGISSSCAPRTVCAKLRRSASGPDSSAGSYTMSVSGYVPSADSYMPTSAGYVAWRASYLASPAGWSASVAGYLVAAAGYLPSRAGYAPFSRKYSASAVHFPAACNGYFTAAHRSNYLPAHKALFLKDLPELTPCNTERAGCAVRVQPENQSYPNKGG